LAVDVLQAVIHCQDKARQEVLLDTLAWILHRDIPFTPSHLDLFFQALAKTDSADRLMQLLPGMLGAMERIAGLEPLTPRHRQELQAIQKRLAQADKKKQKNAA